MSMNTHHTINYVEFYAADVSAVKAFYQTAFGWQFTDYGPGYTAFSHSGIEGGFEQSSQPAIKGALVILYSKDLEASLAAVKQAGGIITRDIFSFPGGRRFHFTDPSGNELAVWSK